MGSEGPGGKPVGPPPILATVGPRSAAARLRAEPFVGVDHGLAVGAGLGEPLRGEALPDLLQARLQVLARRQHFQPMGGELLALPLVLIPPHPPTPPFPPA